MTVSRKAILSLIISLVFCIGIAVLAYTGLFDLLETSFYNPSIIEATIRETGRDAELIQEFLYDLHNRFVSSLNEPAVRRSFLSTQNTADIFERSRIYGLLQASVSGLHSVRFVDDTGANIHFSTYSPDIISQDQHSIVYRTYHEDPANLPFDEVRLPAQGEDKLTLDRDRLIFSFPFNDSLGVFRGTALFTVSISAVSGQLANAGRVKAGEDITINTVPPGIISVPPGISKTDILARVSAIWGNGTHGFTPFVSEDSRATLALVSVKTRQGILYGRIIYGNTFLLSDTMRILLLAAIFLTLYLIIFFFSNLKPDAMTVIRYRLQNLQGSLDKQFDEWDNDMDWAMKLEQRREDIRDELKRGLKFGKDGYPENDVDALIDESWDGLIALAGRRRKNARLDAIHMDADHFVQAFLTDSSAISFSDPSVMTGMNNENDFGVLEELEVVEGDGAGPAAPPVTVGSNGLLAAATKKQYQSRPDEDLEELEAVEDDEVIVEQDGVHYINSGAFSPDTAAKDKLDNDFKELVESVLGKI